MIDAFIAVQRPAAVQSGALSRIWRLAAGVVPVVLGYFAVSEWVAFADGQKMLNPLAVGTTSTALREWNYGTWQQRYSGALWVKTILFRGIPEAIGWIGPVISVGGLWLAQPAARGIALTCGTLFLIPFMLFTNLHIRHNYYQYAAAPWLVVMLAVVITAVSARLSPKLTALLLTASLAGSGAVYGWHYFGWQQQSFSNDIRLAAMRTVNTMTDPSDAVVFFGCDWSSEWPFHAQRRGIAITARTVVGMQKTINRLPSLLAGRRLGAVVILRHSPQFDLEAGWDPACVPVMLALGNACSGGATPVQVGPFFIFTAAATRPTTVLTTEPGRTPAESR